MKKHIIIGDTEYICSDQPATFSDDDVIFEIVDKTGRMHYAVGGPTDLMGEPIKNIWFIETTNNLEPHSIFPDGMEYDDEYYKSTYVPTAEEEAELNRFLNENID